MTKMSKTQRTAILDFHRGVTAKRHTMIASSRTIAVLIREGWATFGPDVKPASMLRARVRAAYVTTAGLIAAGVDMDAIHAEALESPEHQASRNVLHEQRASFRDQDHAEALREYRAHLRAEKAARYPSKAIEGTRLRPLPASDPHSTAYAPADMDAIHAEALAANATTKES
jgi:hypothetical protein